MTRNKELIDKYKKLGLWIPLTEKQFLGEWECYNKSIICDDCKKISDVWSLDGLDICHSCYKKRDWKQWFRFDSAKFDWIEAQELFYKFQEEEENETTKRAGRNLNIAKVNIDDEWYTRYEDIEKYLSNFHEELKGKNIYCPCDGENSNFLKYLRDNEKEIGYKSLTGSSNDFREEENIKHWENADVIITNPPFSLKADFYNLVKKNNCELIVLLPDTLITNSAYKEDLINKKLIMDYTNKSFIRPDGTIKKASASWFNTFKKVWKKEIKFKAGEHEVTDDGLRYYNRCDNIDFEHKSKMFVPVTFIKNSNISDFEIIESSFPIINGKKRFQSLLVKKITKGEE